MNIKAARYKLSRRITFRGLPISVETDKGELRHWFDPHENKSGTTKMRFPYGYIRRTEGVDGDHVDCYVGPNERAKNVYIIHQMKAPEFKKYDEDKCMLGFLTAEDAKRAYLAHYNKPGFFGSMTTMPFEEFENKVKATFEEPKKIATMSAEDYGLTAGSVAAIPLTAVGGRALAEVVNPWRNREVAQAQKVAPITPEKIETLRKATGLGSDVSIERMARGGSSYYHPLERRIALSSTASLPTAAHEMGHATGLRFGLAAAPLSSLRYAPFLGAALADPDTRTAKAMPWLSAGMGLPLVAEEARASYRAAKALRAIGSPGARVLLPFLARYGLAAVGPALGMEGLRRLRSHAKEKYGEATMKYANLARALENPEVASTIRSILTRPSPAMRGTLEIGAKGKRFIPVAEDISLETLRRQALHQPPAVPTRTAPAAPMYYEPGDIMTSAKFSAFLKRAQAYGQHLATVAFRKQADAALGDPNFWQGGTDAMNAPPPPPATAEDAIGLLPGGTFQGLNIRVTPDGQRSTTVKATPDAMQDPSGLNAIFAAEPGAKVELANPETAVPGTQVPTADNGGVPAGSPGQQTAPVSTIPEAAGGAGDPGIGKVAAIIRAGRAQALEKMASMSTEDRLRKIGPAIGATAGIVSAALSRQPMTAAKVLGRVGGGATIGWLPDIYASGYEALR